jgi:hypothetical protein
MRDNVTPKHLPSTNKKQNKEKQKSCRSRGDIVNRKVIIVTVINEKTGAREKKKMEMRCSRNSNDASASEWSVVCKVPPYNARKKDDVNARTRMVGRKA